MQEAAFEKSSELFEIRMSVRPLQNGLIPLAHGYHIYALFLNIIHESNPHLSEQLHQDQAVKPFTVSTLEGKMRRHLGQWSVSTEDLLHLRLTFLRSQVFSHFIDGSIRRGSKPVNIAEIPFRVEEIRTTPLADDGPVYTGYQQILDIAPGAGQIDIEFLTPTVFRSKGKRNSVFPEPSLVFGSYFNKWQELTSVKLDDGLAFFFDKITVTRYNLETVVWDFGAYQEVGFSGKCRFEVDSSLQDRLKKQINALAIFGKFCGTGAKTTMGMGQTRRVVQGMWYR